MAGKSEYVPDAKNTLWRRQEQLKRWDISDTNKESDRPRNTAESRVKFDDGCVFLAACSSCDTDEVNRLLSVGADINTTNVDGLTALHQACIDNNVKMVKFLVEHGANINASDNEGWTALHATASCGSVEMAKFLVEKGARLDAVSNDSELPVDLAEEKKMKILLMELMDKHGIDADTARNEELQLMTRDANAWVKSGSYNEMPHPKTGALALHIAAAKGYVEVIRLLLKAGADINARDNDGWTPLHAAAHWGQAEACKILAHNFASMTATNANGETPIDVSTPELVQLLEELHKKQESSNIGLNDDIIRTNASSLRRSSIIRMSSERKQDVVAKTADDERRQIDGVLRTSSVDELEEEQLHDEEDEEDEEDDDEETESTDENDKSSVEESSEAANVCGAKPIIEVTVNGAVNDDIHKATEQKFAQSKGNAIASESCSDAEDKLKTTVTKSASISSVDSLGIGPSRAIPNTSDLVAVPSTITSTPSTTNSLSAVDTRQAVTKNDVETIKPTVNDAFAKERLTVSSEEPVVMRRSSVNIGGNVPSTGVSSNTLQQTPATDGRSKSLNVLMDSGSTGAGGSREGVSRAGLSRPSAVREDKDTGLVTSLNVAATSDGISSNSLSRSTVGRTSSVQVTSSIAVTPAIVSSLSPLTPLTRVASLLSRHEPLQRRPYKSVFSNTDDESKSRASGLTALTSSLSRQTPLAGDSPNLIPRSSATSNPITNMSSLMTPTLMTSALSGTAPPTGTGVTSAPTSTVPSTGTGITSAVLAPTSCAPSVGPGVTSTASAPTSTVPPSAASITSAPTSTVPSTGTSVTSTVPAPTSTVPPPGASVASAMLAQLSYAQPSVEQLRRRREADELANAGASNGTQEALTSASSGPAGTHHLLSSSTIAKLAALANTPRRSIEMPKRDEEKEVERKARAKRARETRRSTQGVTKEDLVKAEEALEAADNSETPSSDTDITLSSSTDVVQQLAINSSKPPEFVSVRKSRDRLVKTTDDDYTVDSVQTVASLIRPATAALSTTDAGETATLSATGNTVTTSVSNTVVSAVSSLPSSSRMSAYRSKYLQEKEQEELRRKQASEEITKAQQVPDGTSKQRPETEPDLEDPSQKSSAIRARRKRDSRRSTGKICADDIQDLLMADDDEDEDDDKHSEAGKSLEDFKSSSETCEPNRAPVSRITTDTTSVNPTSRYMSTRSQHQSSVTDATVGATTSVPVIGSAALARPEPDYKVLYEAERAANDRLRKELKQLIQELTQLRSELDALKSSASRPSGSSLAATTTGNVDRRAAFQEKRVLDKKIAELEEQLKVVETMKADNQRLKDENGALIRVISKLSK
jgi:protein phosphatase 1 regulatory subunit 12A